MHSTRSAYSTRVMRIHSPQNPACGVPLCILSCMARAVHRAARSRSLKKKKYKYKYKYKAEPPSTGRLRLHPPPPRKYEYERVRPGARRREGIMCSHGWRGTWEGGCAGGPACDVMWVDRRGRAPFHADEARRVLRLFLCRPKYT